MEENSRTKFRTCLAEFGISFEENVPLSTKTWIHRGGRAGFYVCPDTTEKLRAALDICLRQGVEPIVVGHTSNIYFSNDFNPDLVVTTLKLTAWELKDDVIVCQPGVNVRKLSAFCIEHGIDGFYGLVDLPGTVAGAVVNNSSCFGCSIAGVLAGVNLYQRGTVRFISDELNHSYRSSALKTGELRGTILRVYLKARKADRDELSVLAARTREVRRRTQEPPAKNLGSTYAEIEYNLSSKIVLKIAYIISGVFKVPEKRLGKKLLLFVYGYEKLGNYISDYNIGCFVWRDGEADKQFEAYRRFIGKVSKSARLEIEYRDK